MSELLDRTFEEQSVEQRELAGGAGPPLEMPDIERYLRPRWPRNAKIIVAVLAVLAVAGVFGTLLQYFGDDDVDTITAERDELLAENADLTDKVVGLEMDNIELGVQLDATSAELATSNAQISDLTVRIGDLVGQVDDQLMVNETLVAERDALVAMFPMMVDTSLVGVDVTGPYAVRWIPVYNSGLADLALPNVSQIAISQTPEGWLQVSIPGVINADLHRTDGALFTMVDATTVVTPVDGVARTARVAITIYAGETATALDGATTVTDLGMSIAISTPASGSAPAGVAMYGAELTPQG